MDTFDFTLQIDQRLAEESAMDAIYARCADCSLLVDGEVTLLQFHREARSLPDAIRAAIADVNAAGFHVSHVGMEPESLTMQSE